MHEKGEAKLRLRKDQLWRHARSSGVATDSELARHLKVSQSTVLRLLRGDIGPGEHVIAQTLVAFPDLRFEDLFEVIDKPHARSAA